MGAKYSEYQKMITWSKGSRTTIPEQGKIKVKQYSDPKGSKDPNPKGVNTHLGPERIKNIVRGRFLRSRINEDAEDALFGVPGTSIRSVPTLMGEGINTYIHTLTTPATTTKTLLRTTSNNGL